MSTNAAIGFQKAELEYYKAKTNAEKLAALQVMLREAPKHKSSGKLNQNIKERIAKLKEDIKKDKIRKKSGGGSSLSIKREGAAQVCIVGTTNSGKSTLLKQLTNANVEIAPYPFTTKKPEVGVMDYQGVKIQIVEIPAIFERFSTGEQGPTLLSIIKQCDLIIFMFNTPQEKQLLDKELIDIEKPRIIYNNQENFPAVIWDHLDLIKIYTKQPGKEKGFPPVAFKKGSTVKDVAQLVHKDLLKKFKFARIYGPSAKFPGQTVGLEHRLQDDDTVEIHHTK